MFITSFEEQNITYRSCSNLRIHLSYFLIISGSLIQIISNDKDAPKQVVDVIHKAVENYDSNDSNNHKVINDIKYSAISNRATGTWFSIEPK